MKDQDIIEIVSEINDEIYNSIGEVYKDYYLFNLTTETDGNVTLIKYLGFIIWDSDNDERPEVEPDVYIPLKQFLLNNIQIIFGVYKIMMEDSYFKNK